MERTKLFLFACRLAAVSLSLLVGLVVLGCAQSQSTDGGTALTIMPVPPVTAAQRRLLPDAADISADMRSGEVPPAIIAGGAQQVGLLMGNPVGAGLTANERGFASACSDYLQLVGASQAALGGSPSVAGIGRAAAEIGKPNMMIDAADVPTLSRALGVSDIAVGTISKSGGGYQLTYRILDGRSGAPVGDDVRMAGSESAILRDLPAAAAELDEHLGIAETAPIPAVGCSAADFAFFGSSLQSGILANGDTAGYEHLADHCPVAAFGSLMLLHFDTPMQSQAAIDHALALNPENPMIYGVVADDYSDDLAKYNAALIKDTFAHPANYLYEMALAKLYASRGASWTQAENAAIAAVNASPLDPDAWVVLGRIYSEQADSVRRGRAIGGLTESQLEQLNTPYSYWLGCSEQAVKLDDKDIAALINVSNAAAFSSHGDEAEAALMHAMHVAADPYDAYNWGLDFYLQRWYGDSDKLTAIGTIAANDSVLTADEERRLAENVDKGKHFGIWRMLIYSAQGKAKKWYAADPRNPDAATEMAEVLTAMGREPQALPYYERAAALAPRQAYYQVGAGECLYDIGRYPAALGYYLAAVALSPQYPRLHFEIGLVYKRERKFPLAIAEMNRELALYPNSTVAYDGLGDVYYEAKQYDKAARSFLTFSKAVPWNQDDWELAAESFDDAGEMNAALGTIAEAETYFPTDTNLQIDAQDCYLKLKEPDKSISLCEDVIAASSDPTALAYSYENMAEAYLQEHKMGQARAAWKQASAAGNPTMAAIADGYLKKYGT